MKMTFARIAAVLLSLPLAVAQAQQETDTTPLKLVVPYTPGGTTDGLARLLQKSLADVMKRPVVIENKPGAAGTIGTSYVAKAPADGNTIVFGNQGPNAIVPATRKTPYDPIEDLRPISTVAFMPLVLAVSSETGARSLKDFLAQARQRGSDMNYGSSGIGSFAHLTGHEFARLGKLDMTHVPYKGGSEVVTGLLSGSIQGSFLTSLEAVPLAQSGKMRIIGVGSPQRSAALPEVPTVGEELPGFNSVIWFAVFAPKGTSDAVADQLRKMVVAAVQRPEYQKYLAERGAEARTSTPKEVTDLIRRDMKYWGDVVRSGNIPM